MSYLTDLSKETRTLKARIESLHSAISEKSKKGEFDLNDFRELNNLRVNLQTVKSRIRNYGKSVYMIDVNFLK